MCFLPHLYKSLLVLFFLKNGKNQKRQWFSFFPFLVQNFIFCNFTFSLFFFGKVSWYGTGIGWGAMDSGLGNKNGDVEDKAVYALHVWHAVSCDSIFHPAEDQTGILLRPDQDLHHLPPPRLHGRASFAESYRRRFD